MKSNVRLDIPKKTVILRNKYVYYKVDSYYDKLSKQTRPKRVLIGIKDNDKLIPNSNYYDYFEDDLLKPSDKSDTIITGPYIVFDSIISNLKLDRLLVDIFPFSDKLLDIAYYSIIKESNVMAYIDDYAYNHLTYSDKSFKDTNVSDLLKKMSDKDIDTFINAWCNINPKKDIYITYDSTNINTSAGDIGLAEFGHSKDNRDLPEVNISLAINKDDYIPLFYDTYSGSIIDNSECALMVDRAKRYGFKDIGFILDRGYFSIRNIKYFDANNYSFIIMAKASALFVKEAIDKVRYKLKNSSSYYLKEYGLSGITIERTINNEDKKKRYFHIYLDDESYALEKRNILSKFIKMDEELTNRVNKKLTKKEDITNYERYYRLKFNEYGYLESFKRKEDKIDETLNDLGCFVIITSKKMSALEALDTYRSRDSIEKVFRTMKSYLGYDTFRVHDEDRLKAKTFIYFIALIIRSEFFNHIKPLYLKDNKSFTVPKTLKELERISLTKLSDDKYHLRYLLTSKQKRILESFNINEDKYKNITKDILTKLNK